MNKGSQIVLAAVFLIVTTIILSGAYSVSLNQELAQRDSYNSSTNSQDSYPLPTEYWNGTSLPYPPALKLTMQQVQETINYFKSRGFSLEVYTNDNSSWRTIPVWLNMGVVDLENKEALATFAVEHSITELKVYIDSTYVSFNAYVYNNSPLPVIYSFSATIVPTQIAPTVSIIPKPSILRVISPTNTTYSTNSIELTYNINSKVLWSYYSIDASEYVDLQHLLHDNGLIPFKGNITLNLSEGPHRLKIAVQTEESRFSSAPIAYQTIDFTIVITNNIP